MSMTTLQTLLDEFDKKPCAAGMNLKYLKEQNVSCKMVLFSYKSQLVFDSVKTITPCKYNLQLRDVDKSRVAGKLPSLFGSSTRLTMKKM